MSVDRRSSFRREGLRRHRRKDLRCHCGKLLCRVTVDGLVFRCPRCKREMVIDLADAIANLDSGWAEVNLKERRAQE